MKKKRNEYRFFTCFFLLSSVKIFQVLMAFWLQSCVLGVDSFFVGS